MLHCAVLITVLVCGIVASPAFSDDELTQLDRFGVDLISDQELEGIKTFIVDWFGPDALSETAQQPATLAAHRPEGPRSPDNVPHGLEGRTKDLTGDDSTQIAAQHPSLSAQQLHSFDGTHFEHTPMSPVVAASIPSRAAFQHGASFAAEPSGSIPVPQPPQALSRSTPERDLSTLSDWPHGSIYPTHEDSRLDPGSMTTVHANEMPESSHFEIEDSPSESDASVPANVELARLIRGQRGKQKIASNAKEVGDSDEAPYKALQAMHNYDRILADRMNAFITEKSYVRFFNSWLDPRQEGLGEKRRETVQAILQQRFRFEQERMLNDADRTEVALGVEQITIDPIPRENDLKRYRPRDAALAEAEADTWLGYSSAGSYHIVFDLGHYRIKIFNVYKRSEDIDGGHAAARGGLPQNESGDGVERRRVVAFLLNRERLRVKKSRRDKTAPIALWIGYVRLPKKLLELSAKATFRGTGLRRQIRQKKASRHLTASR